MQYVALADDGIIWNLCDCGDFDAAEESAYDMGINAMWIADEPTWRAWIKQLKRHAEYAESLKKED